MTLSARQLECLFWIAAGKGNRDIGSILGLSPLTVKNHVAKLLVYYDVGDRTAAVVKAMLLGHLDAGALLRQYRLDLQ